MKTYKTNKKYFLRLDDACPKMNVDSWGRIETLLDKYGVTPLVGVIPSCQDPSFDNYHMDFDFWNRVKRWKDKGWIIALHGYSHVYSSRSGGINPVHNRSEFAGEPIDVQKGKISMGVSILRENGINPLVFFAPSHTFDKNTLLALQEESDIRIVSDTIANDSYYRYGFTFVPQQSGRVRKTPFKVTTFCYHPNTMDEESFDELEAFLSHNSIEPFELKQSTRKRNLFDTFLSFLYRLKHNRIRRSHEK